MKKYKLRSAAPGFLYFVLTALLVSLMLCACAADSAPSEKQSEKQIAQTDNPAAAATKEKAVKEEVPDTESVLAQAAEISEKYGVKILCGNDVPLTYTDYTAEVLNDNEKNAAALKELDRTLSIYPPGFFSSVREGFCDSITICLAKNLHSFNDDTYIESAYAFTTVQDDTIWLVLNTEEALQSSTLVHEITHVIDYRLLGMHEMQENEWNRLNPPDFSYYNAYLDDRGTDLRVSGSKEYTALSEQDPDRIWFWDPYSKTFAMEDRARLMEKLLEDAVPGSSPSEKETEDIEIFQRCFSSPNVQAKLRFYFYTLRQTFGNARWPEETFWEAQLQKAAKGGA